MNYITEKCAVIYARYSSHSQTEQSIEGQLHDAYEFAKAENLVVIGEYIDRALTGTKDARPDFQRMIKDAEKHQFQFVIVWKLDRFARNRYDSATYKARLKKHGVRVLSVMERISDNPEGIILEGLLESMAEYYSANLSENIKRGMAENRRKGLFLGGRPPFGYVLDKESRKLVKDPETAKTVQEIYSKYANGIGLSQIIQDLNDRHVKAPSKKWTYSTFCVMLSNQNYLGSDLAEQIIDQETFDRVTARRQQNRHAPAAHKAEVRYILGPVCFCGLCGSRMVGDLGRSRNGTQYHYYACAKKKHSHECTMKNVRQDMLEPFVIRSTMDFVLDPDQIESMAKLIVDQYNREFDDSQLRDLDKRIGKLKEQLDNLIETLMDAPKSARPAIMEKMEVVEAERTDLEADRARLALTTGIKIQVPEVEAWLRTFADGDPEDPEFVQRLVDVFINSIWVYPDKIAVFFNTKNPNARKLECSDIKYSGGAEPYKSEHHPYYIFIHGIPGIIFFRNQKK